MLPTHWPESGGKGHKVWPQKPSKPKLTRVSKSFPQEGKQMQLNIHNITKINTEQKHHSFGDRSFFCLTLDVQTEDKGAMSVCLFSEQPITLVNPAIIQVD
jgi:hypothetical protein